MSGRSWGHKSSDKGVGKSKEGNYGEEPWTVMNMDGAECVSQGVHVVGVVVGYHRYSRLEFQP